MATATKKAATKKSAAKKGASKKASASKGKKTASKKESEYSDFADSQPENGQLIEFTDSVTKRGVYNADKGVVYINGEEFVPASWKKVDDLTGGEENAAQAESRKQKTFNDLGVPKHRQGENLHEQNPDLAASMKREEVREKVNEIEAPNREATKVGEAVHEDEGEGEE